MIYRWIFLHFYGSFGSILCCAWYLIAQYNPLYSVTYTHGTMNNRLSVRRLQKRHFKFVSDVCEKTLRVLHWWEGKIPLGSVYLFLYHCGYELAKPLTEIPTKQLYISYEIKKKKLALFILSSQIKILRFILEKNSNVYI